MLNSYFVPVYVDGTYLSQNPSAPVSELAAYRELFQELHRVNADRQQAGQPQLSVGTVHAYVFSPTGTALDSLHVAHAKPSRVIEMLETAVKSLDVPAGKAIVQPGTQSRRPEAPDDALVLHVTARYLVPRNQERARQDVEGDLVPIEASGLGNDKSGNWHDLPSEDWLVLERAQSAGLLPKEIAAVGDNWNVDKGNADELLTRFYPTTELNELDENRIDEGRLTGEVISVEKDRVRARIDGNLKMKHAFYPNRDDNNFVEATIVGYIEFDQASRKIHLLEIVTERATYGGDVNGKHTFGVAVRNVP